MKFELKTTPPVSTKKIIYGVTDRSGAPLWEKLNDFLIDHSPVKMKEKGLLFNSLRLLVSSGIRFTKALGMLSQRTHNLRLKRILDTINYDMTEDGKKFSEAMRKYPTVFRTSEIKMVYSGEITGKIEDVLDTISVQIQKNLELEGRIQTAMMYPSVVLSAIVLAIGVVMGFVVPKFETLFESFGSELPAITKFMIGASHFVQHSWWLVITIVVAGIFWFRNWKNSETGKRAWHGFLLELPILKPLINNIQTVHVAGNLSTMMASGIPVTKALQILSKVVTNSVISDGILNAEKMVRDGKQMHEGFREQKLFDPVLGEVVEVGEQSGSIPEILKKTADQYQMEIDAQLRNIPTLIEPVVIVLVGGAVIFMAFAILTPVFKMQQVFTG